MTTVTDVREIGPISGPETEALAAAETARMVAALRALGPADWTRQTDCPAWDVRALSGHVLGMTEDFTGLHRMVSRFRAGQKRAGDGPMIDGVTALQVEEHAHLGPAELIERMAVAGPVQARWRARRRLLRAMPDKEKMPDGTVETWRMGYVFDVILTRDTWMHRVDLARATGRAHELSAAHDGRIVADVVAEWARRHGQPFTLHLTGPAGGAFASGAGGHELVVDAVDFCRTVSGRAQGTGLLTQQVPF